MVYERELSKRKSKLINLVLAELLMKRNGKYMDQIANGLWLQLEESTWVWPAHIGYQHAGQGLPDPTVNKSNLGLILNRNIIAFSGTNR